MTINDILKEYNLTQIGLSRRLEIPVRTIQDWVAEKRTPSEWVLNLINNYLNNEKEIKTMKLEIIMNKLPVSEEAKKAIEIMLNDIFDDDTEAMERAISNSELTINCDIENKAEWLNYVDLSDTDHCMAIRIKDGYTIADSEAMSKLFGWE